jgi:hypothetical protein
MKATAGRERRSKEEAYLEKAIDRYSEAVAATGRAALAKLRAMFPGARLMVYERVRQLPIGFAPADGGSLFSIVLYPRWVRFFFLEGVLLNDPEGRLEGKGNQVRSLRVEGSAEVLDDPYIAGLIDQALAEARVDMRSGKAEVVIKSKISLD